MPNPTCLCRPLVPDNDPDKAYIAFEEHCPIHSQERCICDHPNGVYCHEALSLQQQLKEVEHQLAYKAVGAEWVRLNEAIHEHYRRAALNAS